MRAGDDKERQMIFKLCLNTVRGKDIGMGMSTNGSLAFNINMCYLQFLKPRLHKSANKRNR